MDTLIVVLCGNNIVTLMSSVGFAPVGEEWPSCYFQYKLRLFFVIYVDDFKMAGPKDNLSSGWSLLQKGLVIETPVPIGVYLGCGHEEGTMKVGDVLARTMITTWRTFWPLVLIDIWNLPEMA